MSLTSENGGMGYTMNVTPAYGGYPTTPVYLNGGYGNGGFGFGGDGDWIILFLFAMMCGGGFGGWGGGFGGFGGMYEFPWLLNGQQNVLNGVNSNTNAGFNQAALQSAIGDLSTNVVSGFGDVNLGIAGINQNICSSTGQIQNAMCQGFAGTTAAVTGAQNAITAQLYNNEIANLNRSFDAQTAATHNSNAIQAQLAQCCSDNKAATQDVKYTIATEACATRAANTQNTQAILDKLCQLELDGYKRENDQLRSQLQFANMQASQAAQTAELRTSQATTANQLVSELRSCPIPAQPVYGNSPIFTCAQNVAGSTCGCGNGFAN